MPISVDPILPAAAAWYYSDRSGVSTLIDDVNIAAVWDMNNDGAEDPGLLLRDGQQSDTYIDLALAREGLPVGGNGHVVDTATAPTHIKDALKDVSNHLTVWFGWHHRGVQEVASRTGRTSDEIAGLMSGYKKYADEQLARLAQVISASDDTTTSSAGRILTSVGAPKAYPGVPVIVPAYTLPVPTTPWSY